MRTQGAFYADTPHTGGAIFISPLDITTFAAESGAGGLQLVRNAVGNYSLNRTGGGAETYHLAASLANIKRLIESSSNAGGNAAMPFQEQFGVAAGTAGWPAGAAGLPPFTGAAQLTAPTGDTSKGIKLRDIVTIYSCATVDLTSAGLVLKRTTFANLVAPSVADVPLTSTLAVTANANPRVITSTVNTPVFETTDLTDLTLESTFVLQNGSVFKFFGYILHVDLNYN